MALCYELQGMVRFWPNWKVTGQGTATVPQVANTTQLLRVWVHSSAPGSTCRHSQPAAVVQALMPAPVRVTLTAEQLVALLAA